MTINLPLKPDLPLLLVEDNPANILVAGTLLEHLGWPFEVATNGAEAVRMFEEKKFSLILMDLQMPIMNGIEATRQIRAIEAKTSKSPTPIIALTANDSPELRRSCWAAGMDDLVSKPYYPGHFWEKIKKYLQVVE